MPSKTNQKKTDTCDFFYMWDLKNKHNRNRDINLENKYVVPSGRREVDEEIKRYQQLQNKMSHGDEMYRVGKYCQ